MAHLKRLQGDRWQVRYRDPSGRERARNLVRRVDAERYLHHIEAKKNAGEWVDPQLGRVTLAEWAERYLFTKRHLKPKTLEGYRSLLRNQILPAFGDAPINRIDPMTVVEWAGTLQGRGLSASRVRQSAHLLGAMCKMAMRTGYLARNPVESLDLPRLPRTQMHFLSAGELNALADAARPPYGTLVLLLGYGGLRWGEAAALRRARCDLLRSRIEVVDSVADVGGRIHWGPTKTYQRRTVVLPAFLKDRLAWHLASEVNADADALVFTSPQGAPVRHSNFHRRIWRPALAAAGLGEQVRIHDLRHTAASLLISQGAGPKAISEHLGHSSVQVSLDRYGHLFPSEFEKLADHLDSAYRDAVADGAVKPRGEVTGMMVRGSGSVAPAVSAEG
ncbi:MAG: tyrosine-type recombinase/integrase [Acidimicrobiia bacterium]